MRRGRVTNARHLTTVGWQVGRRRIVAAPSPLHRPLTGHGGVSPAEGVTVAGDAEHDLFCSAALVHRRPTSQAGPVSHHRTRRAVSALIDASTIVHRPTHPISSSCPRLLHLLPLCLRTSFRSGQQPPVNAILARL